MSFKEYLITKVVPMYFMLVTFLVIFICFSGMILDPELRMGYDGLLSPIIYGVIGIIPFILSYSKKELTVRQAMIKNITQFLLLLFLILGFSFYMKVIKTYAEGIAIFLGVCVIYVLISVIQWRNESRTARLLTEALEQLKEQKIE